MDESSVALHAKLDLSEARINICRLLIRERIATWYCNLFDCVLEYSLVLGLVVLDLVVGDARLGRRQSLSRPRGVARDELDAPVRRLDVRRVRGGRPQIVDLMGQIMV